LKATGNPYSTRPLDREECSVWDDLVRKINPGLVFFRSSWLSSMSRAFDADWGVLGLFHGEDLVGGMPLYMLSHWGCKMSIPPLYTPYCGFLFSPISERAEKLEFQTQALAEILTKALSERFDFVALVSPPQPMDLRPFYRGGWNVKVLYSHLLELGSEEKLYSKLDSAVKNKLNKAQKLSVAVEEEEDPSLFFPLWELSLRRQGQKPFIIASKFRELFEDLKGGSLVRLFVARLGADVVASRVAVIDRPLVYDWLAGADSNYFKTGANQLLVWEMIKGFRQEGFSHLDFCGANIPGVADFKSSLGGELVSYYSLSKSFNLKGNLYRWLQSLKRHLRIR
jgi:hypothetical protein